MVIGVQCDGISLLCVLVVPFCSYRAIIYTVPNAVNAIFGICKHEKTVIGKEHFMGRFNLIQQEEVESNHLKKYLHGNDTELNVKESRQLDDGDGYYQTGWDSYCFFTMDSRGFTVDRSVCRRDTVPLQSGAVQNRIVTRAVSSCTIVMLRAGSRFCLMHLDYTSAKAELDSCEITNEFLKYADPDGQGAGDEVFAFFSYSDFVGGWNCEEIQMTDRIEERLRNELGKAPGVYRMIRNDKNSLKEDLSGIYCHIEIGMAFSEENAVIYGDIYKYADPEHGNLFGKLVDYFEIPFRKSDVFDEGKCMTDKVYERFGHRGGCIVV